ncbi:MAG: histidine kinase [Saprospiraceae bacterium]|nr:histidine kinase [Saprospiraceae bacterium]
MHFRSGGEINYRYRLLEADTTFKNTNTRSVNFATLSPGQYTFEVQAQNESGTWSEPSRWSLEIGIYWYQTLLFWALMTAFIIGLSVLWYRDRLIQGHKAAEVRNKIRDLEAEALRAQMNPHFIFNCLNSIQLFINEHDSTSASKYLSDFTRLVRLALHGSVDGRHSLQDEIDMLENYLGLERLRFGEKFTFKIEIDPEFDKDNIFFPPLLIQPFVENALVHGISNKMKGGKINISFIQKVMHSM